MQNDVFLLFGFPACLGEKEGVAIMISLEYLSLSGDWHQQQIWCSHYLDIMLDLDKSTVLSLYSLNCKMSTITSTLGS
jgi:hypothetical protein